MKKWKPSKYMTAEKNYNCVYVHTSVCVMVCGMCACVCYGVCVYVCILWCGVYFELGVWVCTSVCTPAEAREGHVGISCLCSLMLQLQAYATCPAFYVVAGIQTQVLVVAEQTFLPTKPSSQPILWISAQHGKSRLNVGPKWTIGSL